MSLRTNQILINIFTSAIARIIKWCAPFIIFEGVCLTSVRYKKNDNVKVSSSNGIMECRQVVRGGIVYYSSITTKYASNGGKNAFGRSNVQNGDILSFSLFTQCSPSGNGVHVRTN